MPPTVKTKKPTPQIGGVSVDDVNEKISVAMVRMAAQGSVPAARTVLDLIAKEQARAGVSSDTDQPTTDDRGAYLANELLHCHSDLTAARRAGSWQAVAALRRQALRLRADLDAHNRNLANRFDDVSDDLLMSSIVDNAVNLPPVLRDSIMETLEALDTGAIVPLKQNG